MGAICTRKGESGRSEGCVTLPEPVIALSAEAAMALRDALGIPRPRRSRRSVSGDRGANNPRLVDRRRLLSSWRHGNVGPGGGGTRDRSRPDGARLRASSRRKLSSPLAIAQRWFAENTGLNRNDMCRSNGLSARTRQSYLASTSGLAG